MLDRRQFLHDSAGFVPMAACPIFGKTWWLPSESGSLPPWTTEYEQILRSSKWLPNIGIPNNWDLVRQGLYPFAPERIATLHPPSSFANNRKRQVLKHCAQWREDQWKQFPKCRDENERIREGTSRNCGWLTISTQKLDVIVSIVEALTAHYPSQDIFEKWATGLAVREEDHFDRGGTYPGRENSLSLGNWPNVAVGVADAYQRWFGDRYVVTANEPVDWWVFLFPKGAEWDAIFGQPVNVLLGLVMTGDDDRTRHAWTPYELEAMRFLPVLLRRLESDLQQISTLSRVEVAYRLNRELGTYLQQLADSKRRPRHYS